MPMIISPPAVNSLPAAAASKLITPAFGLTVNPLVPLAVIFTRSDREIETADPGAAVMLNVFELFAALPCPVPEEFLEIAAVRVTLPLPDAGTVTIPVVPDTVMILVLFDDQEMVVPYSPEVGRFRFDDTAV
jgi:hypothetical protein